MENMKSVLLVFDDQRELEFIQAHLSENGFTVNKAEDFKRAAKIAERCIPDLIVVNTCNNESEIQLFSQQLKTKRLKNTSILSLIQLKDYLQTSEKEHFVLKPIRPKILLSLIRGVMNKEELSWCPSFH